MSLFYNSALNFSNELKSEVKVKSSLCLTKFHAMKSYLILHAAPRHEGILGELRSSSTPS